MLKRALASPGRRPRGGVGSSSRAALSISASLWRLVDLTSRVVTNAYLDAITDRGLLRRDLLDALVSGKGEQEGVSRLARSLHLKLADTDHGWPGGHWSAGGKKKPSPAHDPTGLDTAQAVWQFLSRFRLPSTRAQT